MSMTDSTAADDPVSRVVREFLAELKQNRGIEVSDDGFLALMNQDSFGNQITRFVPVPTGEIDENKLKEALEEIFSDDAVRNVSGVLSADLIIGAMKRSRCHYLWFC